RLVRRAGRAGSRPGSCPTVAAPQASLARALHGASGRGGRGYGGAAGRLRSPVCAAFGCECPQGCSSDTIAPASNSPVAPNCASLGAFCTLLSTRAVAPQAGEGAGEGELPGGFGVEQRRPLKHRTRVPHSARPSPAGEGRGRG